MRQLPFQLPTPTDGRRRSCRDPPTPWLNRVCAAIFTCFCSAWIVVEGNVYDVTEFAPTHPGELALPLVLGLGRGEEQQWA